MGKDSLPKRRNDKGPKLRRNECEKIPQWYFQVQEEVFLYTSWEVEKPTTFWRGCWFTKSQRVKGCYEGLDRHNSKKQGLKTC